MLVAFVIMAVRVVISMVVECIVVVAVVFSSLMALRVGGNFHVWINQFL